MIVIHETIKSEDVLNLINEHIINDRGRSKYLQTIYDDILKTLILEEIKEN